MSANAQTGSLPYRRGVGVVLLNSQGLVLAGRRADTPEAWQMPQGGIDDGESPVEAALRELKEEVGTDKARVLRETAGWLRYDLPPDVVGRVWRGRYRGQEQKWFALRFLGTDADIDLATHNREFDAWRWASADDLTAGIVGFKRDLYRRVFDEFRDLLD